MPDQYRFPLTLTTLVYTDGSCWPNPGPGGWAWVAYLPDGIVRYATGGQPTGATNNLMELHAVVAVLETLDPQSLVLIRTDSKWVMNCATGVWGRRTEQHQALWTRYDDAVLRHSSVVFRWVRGHAGEQGNELVDEMAGAARRIAAGQEEK